MWMCHIYLYHNCDDLSCLTNFQVQTFGHKGGSTTAGLPCPPRHRRSLERSCLSGRKTPGQTTSSSVTQNNQPPKAGDWRRAAAGGVHFTTSEITSALADWYLLSGKIIVYKECGCWRRCVCVTRKWTHPSLRAVHFRPLSPDEDGWAHTHTWRSLVLTSIKFSSCFFVVFFIWIKQKREKPSKKFDSEIFFLRENLELESYLHFSRVSRKKKKKRGKKKNHRKYKLILSCPISPLLISFQSRLRWRDLLRSLERI